MFVDLKSTNRLLLLTMRFYISSMWKWRPQSQRWLRRRAANKKRYMLLGFPDLITSQFYHCYQVKL